MMIGPPPPSPADRPCIEFKSRNCRRRWCNVILRGNIIDFYMVMRTSQSGLNSRNGRIFHIYFLYRDIDNYSAINISIYLLLMDNIILLQATGWDIELVEELSHVIFATGTIRLGGVRSVITDMSEGSATLGGAHALRPEAFAQVPQHADTILEQLRVHVVACARQINLLLLVEGGEVVLIALVVLLFVLLRLGVLLLGRQLFLANEVSPRVAERPGV